MTKPENTGLGLGWAATIGSFAAPLAITVAVTLWQVVNSSYEVDGFGSTLNLVVLFGEASSLLATWLFGLPFVLYLRWRKSLNATAVCAGGAVIGAAFFVALLWFVSSSSYSAEQVLGQAIAGSILGLVVALALCLLARIPFRVRTRRAPHDPGSL